MGRFRRILQRGQMGAELPAASDGARELGKLGETPLRVLAVDGLLQCRYVAERQQEQHHQIPFVADRRDLEAKP